MVWCLTCDENQETAEKCVYRYQETDRATVVEILVVDILVVCVTSAVAQSFLCSVLALSISALSFTAFTHVWYLIKCWLKASRCIFALSMCFTIVQLSQLPCPGTPCCETLWARDANCRWSLSRGYLWVWTTPRLQVPTSVSNRVIQAFKPCLRVFDHVKEIQQSDNSVTTHQMFPRNTHGCTCISGSCCRQSWRGLGSLANSKALMFVTFHHAHESTETHGAMAIWFVGSIWLAVLW